MTACAEFDPLLPLHGAGALAPAEAARVETHLAACAACRAEAAADAEVLSLAKLPPPSDAERRALADLPRRALAELHRSERRRTVAKRVVAGIAVAAALVLAVMAPAVLRRASHATVTAAWQEPDLETLWEDAGVLSGTIDSEAVALAGETTDAALDF